MDYVDTIVGNCAMPDGTIVRRRISLNNRYIERVETPLDDGEREGTGYGNTLALSDDYLISPGLIDLQVNGGVGGEFRSSKGHLSSVAGSLIKHGVTAFQPTVTSIPFDRLARLIPRLWQEAQEVQFGATPIGIHVEGPLLAPEFRGGHPLEFLSSDVETYIDTMDSLPGVRLITVAPDVDGVVEKVIPWAREKQIRVSLGHTNATEAQVQAAANAGARFATHIYNAMRAPTAREAGLVGAVLGGSPALAAGLIADMVHVSGPMLRLALQSCSPNRIFLVSDASAVTGLPVGPHKFQDRTIINDGSSARLQNGVLVGSVLTLDKAIRNLVVGGFTTPAQAIRLATVVPARLVGDEQRGRIADGCVADFAIFNSRFEVTQVIKDGNLVVGEAL